MPNTLSTMSGPSIIAIPANAISKMRTKLLLYSFATHSSNSRQIAKPQIIIETLKNKTNDPVGNRVRAKVVKNKMAPPFREAEFDIMYGEGISLIGELIDLGVKLGLVQKSGSWYSMGETRIGQGRDAAKQYLKNNPEIADNLEAEIRRNFDKLMTGQSRVAAKAAGRAVDVSADDFKDED